MTTEFRLVKKVVAQFHEIHEGLQQSTAMTCNGSSQLNWQYYTHRKEEGCTRDYSRKFRNGPWPFPGHCAKQTEDTEEINDPGGQRIGYTAHSCS